MTDSKESGVRDLKNLFETTKSGPGSTTSPKNLNEELKSLESTHATKEKMSIWLERIVGNEEAAPVPGHRRRNSSISLAPGQSLNLPVRKNSTMLDGETASALAASPTGGGHKRGPSYSVARASVIAKLGLPGVEVMSDEEKNAAASLLAPKEEEKKVVTTPGKIAQEKIDHFRLAAEEAAKQLEEEKRVKAEAEARIFFAKAKAEAEIKAKLEAEAKAKAEAEAKLKAELEAKEAKERAEAEAKAKAEAEAKALQEEEERKREEARRKHEAELRAKAEAEAKAAREAAEAARAEEERQAKLEAEAKAKAAKEAEEHARMLAEQQAKLKAEQEAAEKAKEEEKARAEKKAKEEELARQLREAEEKAAKAAEEARAAKEAEEKTQRLNEEKRKREEEEEKRRQEERDRLEREEAARIEAETKARIQAELKAKEEAEERARVEAALKAKAEAEARAEAEAKAKAEEEARMKEEAEERAREIALKLALEEEQAKLKAEAEAQAQAMALAEKLRIAEAEADAKKKELEAIEKAKSQEAQQTTPTTTTNLTVSTTSLPSSTTTPISSPKSPHTEEREKKLAEQDRINKYKMREKLLDELKSSEKYYVRFLNIIVDSFMNPLFQLASNSKSKITEDQVRIIFQNVDDLRRLHEAVYIQMQQTRHMPSIFLNPDILAVYSAYLDTFERKLAIINSLKNNNHFLDFLHEKRKDNSTGSLNLLSFLIMPIQRINRYFKLLVDIKHHTRKHDLGEEITEEEKKQARIEREEYPRYTQVLDKLDPLFKSVCERRAKFENACKVLNVQNRVRGKYDSLYTPERQYIREGEFEKNADGKLFFLFLFDDLLLWSNTKYEFRGSLPLNNVIVSHYTELKDKVGFKIGYYDSTDPKAKPEDSKLICICANAKEKNDWMQKISAAVVASQALVNTRKVFRSGSVSISSGEAERGSIIRKGSLSISSRKPSVSTSISVSELAAVPEPK